MTTEAITPLRQRMIEDMNARKLCAGTQKGPHSQLQAVCGVLKQSPDTGTLDDVRPLSAAPGRDGREHLYPQPHHDWAAVPVSGDDAAIGSCVRDLSPARAAEASTGDEHRRETCTAADIAGPAIRS